MSAADRPDHRHKGVRGFTHNYFKGKGQVEKAVVESGLSYAILRPCLVFGPNGTLINDIAWLLRRLPVFTILGNGLYKVSPVFVGGLAELAVDAGQRTGNETMDAVGPEKLAFEELVRLIKHAIGSRAVILHAPRSWR